MPAAPTPSDENERLEALYRYDILDTEAEELFDSAARVAAAICETPIALITLVDPDRQWFKAKVGTNLPSTERDKAFCAHAILQREVMIVPDTLIDERFRDNPLVQGRPDIRFYAGAPLITPDNFALGTLCVIDREPRTLSNAQIEALAQLSRQVCANLELRLQAKKLRELNESKNRLFSIVSHDLRAPLSSVISLADLLLAPDYPLSAQEQRKFMLQLRASAATTLKIADDLLTMAQFESGAIRFEPASLELHPLLAEGRALYHGKCASKSLTVSIDCPEKLFVLADRAMLRSILQNLLSNAIKFSPRGRAISLSAFAEAGRCRIEVKDQGVGIRKSTLNALFKLEHIYSAVGTEGEKGSGLGLSLCKQFALKMNGELAIESIEGQGTLATLWLPLAV